LGPASIIGIRIAVIVLGSVVEALTQTVPLCDSFRRARINVSLRGPAISLPDMYLETCVMSPPRPYVSALYVPLQRAGGHESRSFTPDGGLGGVWEMDSILGASRIR